MSRQLVRVLVASFVAALLIVAIGVHYLVSRHYEELLARKSVLDVDTMLRLALQLKSVEHLSEVKDPIDVSLMASLTQLKYSESRFSADPETVQFRIQTLRALRRFWRDNPPFLGKQWNALKSKPEWAESRAEIEAMLDRAERGEEK
jgi:hypothetical protein